MLQCDVEQRNISGTGVSGAQESPSSQRVMASIEKSKRKRQTFNSYWQINRRCLPLLVTDLSPSSRCSRCVDADEG